MEFSFGIASFVCAVVFPLVYLIGRQLRHFSDWADRAQRPKQRAGVFVVLSIVIGLVAGSTAQPLVDVGVACHQRGENVVPCVLLGPLYQQKNPTPSTATTIPHRSMRGSSNHR